MQRDEIDLDKLTNFQKRKLIKFYNVDSIDDLEVTDDGDIIIKKKGGAKPSDVIVYIEDYEGKQIELSIEEFLTKQKDPSLGFSDMSKDEAKTILKNYLLKIIKLQKKKDIINTLCIEHIDKSHPELLLFQQFVIYHADKLTKILCGNEINKKYVKATGNPGYSDVDFYNIIKKSDNEIVIKGFSFCDNISNKELFINLVCGTGGTGKLIESMLEAVTKKMLHHKPKYISLESIDTEQALEFYSKMGFRKPKKETIETINDMVNSKAKTFTQYSNERGNKAGGKLYLFPINTEGEKQLKKLKCEWLYSPVKWFDVILTLKKEKKPKKYIKNHLIETMRTTKLEGDGIGDFFKNIYNKGKDIVSNIANRFKPKLDDFTNQSKATLAKYGNWRIVDMTIRRKPIMGVLDKFFNVLSFGKFEELKKKYGYDKLFHLQLNVTLYKDGVHKMVTIEKNETIDITEDTTGPDKDTETQRVVMPKNRMTTLNQLIDGTRNRVGDKTFFSYDPFNNNCQFFIRYLLEALGMYSEKESSFLFQDLKEFQKGLPNWLPKFARSITDLGATVSNIRGKGKP